MFIILYVITINDSFDGIVLKFFISLCKVGSWDYDAGWVASILFEVVMVIDKPPRCWDTLRANTALHVAELTLADHTFKSSQKLICLFIGDCKFWILHTSIHLSFRCIFIHLI